MASWLTSHRMENINTLTCPSTIAISEGLSPGGNISGNLSGGIMFGEIMSARLVYSLNMASD